MRVKVLIILVIVYILAAFAWLTFSLLRYANSDYALKNDVLEAGLSACTLQVIEQAKNGSLGKTDSVNYYLQQLKIEIDESKLEAFVSKKFNQVYRVDFKEIVPGKKNVQLAINPLSIKQLTSERFQQRNIWIYQSVLLLILVAAGIYGVYYSISSIYKLNKRQNNFLLSVTHEFKTPIASIRLMLQTSKHPKISEDKRSELVENSIQNTFRLEDLAENMLTAMQIENDKYNYQFTEINLTQMTKEVVESQSIQGKIEAHIKEGITLLGDGFIWRMVINNLIENAFKYSEAQPIKVVLTTHGDKKILRVSDSGIGIRPEDVKNIFKKFYRVQDEETRTTKGTGLGLFIVKQAVEKHRGTVSVKPNIPNGSVFTIELP